MAQTAGTTGIRTIDSRQNVQATDFFSLDGRQQPSLRRGLNIVRMADGTTKKIIY